MLKHITSVMCLIGVIMSFTAGVTSADDLNLYRVSITSRSDADALTRIDPAVLCSVQDGYLVMAPSEIGSWLISAGLAFTVVADNIDPDALYRDIRLDQTIPLSFPVVFKEAGICIYAIDAAIDVREEYRSALYPAVTRDLPIIYSEPVEMTYTINISGDLDALIDGISQDTLTAYVEHLQSYGSRAWGTSGNLYSAYWIKDMLKGYGYDSVAFDTGTWDYYGDLYFSRNVLAYKPGSVYPYHQIIIGAHRDCGDGSPGADDNGSGVAAVLDMARILQGYDNRMTFIYILFDTEEYSMGGSTLYAEKAYERGDHIEFMASIDMIGNYENENDVYANYASREDSIYGILWSQLADSIPGIDLVGHLNWQTFTDNRPFDEYGYSTIWIYEYILSTVFHTPHDSTTYMNFDYMTRIVKTTLATMYTLDQNFVPNYELLMTGPEYPEMLVPETTTPIEAVVLEYGGATLVPGSVRLHYIIDHTDSTAVEMMETGGGTYTADLPALPCGHIVNYFVTAEDDSLGVVYYPNTGLGVRAFVTGDLSIVFEEDFGGDPGWSVSGDAVNGEWELDSNLTALGGNPIDDFDGNEICYGTGKMSSWDDVDGGTTTLVSPEFDASEGTIMVQYARWYSNYLGGAPHTDIFQVFISNDDGQTWALAETVGPVEQASGGWYVYEFLISDFVEPTAHIRLRFDASDLGEDSNIEAAVDAVRFISLSNGPRIITPSLPSWTAGMPFSRQLEAIVCSGEIIWSDKYGQLDGSWLSLDPSGLLEGTPLVKGRITFTARTLGESGNIDEQAYTVIVNPALVIVTSSISHGTIGVPVEQELLASGGTGTPIWTDRDDVLSSSGLTLSPDGHFSGTPTTVGDFSFTARVTDAIGAITERYYDFRIREPFLCGDANNDQFVNVGDVVYIINYVFLGGSPPHTPDAGDVNHDGGVDVADAVYLINYIFKAGSPPSCP